MTPDQIVERLERLAKAATPGPYTSDEGRGIWCHNAKIGGVTKIFDIRGWGYLTGQGHGALGLSEGDAIRQQRANGDYIAACSPSEILALCAAYRELAAQAPAIRRSDDPPFLDCTQSRAEYKNYRRWKRSTDFRPRKMVEAASE